MKNVLVVDSDPITLNIFCTAIEKYNFKVVKATKGSDAMSMLQKYQISAIILGLNLPDFNSLEILKQIRSHPILNSIAIIIVTENDDKMEAILGLEMGADDYITKSFHHRELIAKLNAILRRTQQLNISNQSCVIFDDLHIDLKKRIVKKQDIDIKLTFKEFEILVLLAINPGEVLSREKIMDAIGGLEYTPETRTIDMHIASIRKKLDDRDKEKVYIDTVSGVGYRFRK